MNRTKIPTFFSILIMMSILACSQPNPEWTMRTPGESASADAANQDTLVANGDSLKLPIPRPDIDEALDNAEGFYAVGVSYFQLNSLDSAQTAYEQSLAVLSELDLDPEQNPEQASRMERLLNEIEEDYRLTLIASGTLSSEASVTAFRELFGDLKNFKKLKESPQVRDFNEADTVIYDVDIEWNGKVENSLIYLQTVARENFTAYLARSAVYLPLMEAIFKEKGLPHDLVYLPLIESGFKATAYSYARASGFWQFISSTGRLYGLDHNWWFDERRDFVKSTEAAAEHLKDLYEQFGSWNLALAAYNGGAGRVSREIRRAKSNNFWKLSLHKQTRAYVPLFMAATIIAKEPHKYGFFPEYESPLEFEVVTVDKCISLENVSLRTGIEVFELQRLNPELLRGITPPNIKDYALRLPKGYTDAFAGIYNEIPTEKATNWANHKVRRGETLSAIARKYGISLSALLDVNKLSKKKHIYVGQTLIIPIPAGRKTSSRQSTVVASSQSGKIVKSSPNRYLVKDGDTLWEIATAYGVSIGGIRRLNNLTSNTVYAGRWLKIPQKSVTATFEKADVKYDIYRVKRGDNLTRISAQYGTSPAAIRSANGLTSNRIYPGMRLKIPSSPSSNTQYTSQNTLRHNELQHVEYVVRNGDTLWKIAKAHGVNVSELARWNNLRAGNKLYPGDKLKIYFN